jgi:hypothetical protein
MAEFKEYFFDTYAFCELFKGNPRYKPYSKDIAVITTKLNLVELHYGMFLEKGEKYADKIYDMLNKFCVDVGNEVIKSANAFKAKHKKSNLSYVDCIGYVIAKSRNVNGGVKVYQRPLSG